MKENVYDLTNPQNSIFVTEQFHSGTNINNICGTLIINEKVDFVKFNQAINIFIKNNDSFRLKFFYDNTKIKQYISEYEQFNIEIIDVHSEKDLAKIENTLTNSVFDIINSLLFEFKLFRFDDGHGGFVLNAHHLVSDAWSHSILINEIMDNYSKLLKNQSIEEKEISYVDYINSEKEYSKTEKYTKDELYWNEVFSSIPEIASIPSYKTNSNKLPTLAIRKQFVLQKDFVKQINSFCEQNKVSLYNFFMGVLSIYLSRVSNLDDFVIGTPILNRSNYKEKHTTGMFISVMPFRIALDNEDSFNKFLAKIAKNAMSVFRHQKYSYQKIIENIRKKDSSIPSLFNIMLSYQNMRSNASSSEIDYSSSWHFTNNISDKLDIHLFDINDEGLLNMAYDYTVADYSEKDIIDTHNRLLTICKQVLENSNIALKNIEIVTPEEKHKILYDFNNTKTDYPKDKTIVELFEEQVEKNPDNIAVVFEDQKLTYRELNEKANQLAHYLREQGVKREEIVCINLDKSLEITIAILSILKAGGAYLPLDINYPYDRLKYVINDSKAKIILTNSFFNAEDFTNCLCIDISLNNKTIYNNTTENLKNFNTSTDLAYIMYTSGSTGNPKGSMIIHKNVVRLVKNTNYLDFTKNHTILQAGSLAFDACTFEFWGALLNGLKVYLILKDDLLNPVTFKNYLVKNKISTFFLSAQLFNQLSECNPNIFNTVKFLLVGGDALSVKHINKVIVANPNTTLINGYGPTENTTFSACFTLAKKSYTTNSIPIGKPISNSTCYIVSKNGLLQPIGVPGELWVGGDGVSKGYLNNIALTKEKFVHTSFEDGLIYKTGDLVKWLPNGNIEFIGRIDNQVKIRGFRVELSEINSKISNYPDIDDCVTVVNTINGTKAICSYIISKKDLDTKNIKNYLKSIFPSYMIPTYFVQLGKLPMNINGKIDRKALPIPEITNNNTKIIKPRNDIDKDLVDLLKDILHIDTISINDNFFDLGGDSLSAISFCTHIFNKLNVQLTVRDILNNPIITELSDFIAKNCSTIINENTIQVIEEKAYYPTSSAQKRVYYASQISGTNSMLYNISGGVILNKIPDINKLQKCFNTLINRHEAFKTYFEIIDNNVVQKIDKNVKFNIEIEENCEKNINSLFRTFAKPFDFSKAPLIRVKLATFEDNTALLLLDIHHIISDGTSQKILINELCKLYNNEVLPELSISYKDYSVYENDKINSKKFDESKKYWINQFNNEIPVLNMPTSFPRPATQSFEGAKVYSIINNDLTKQINEMCKILNITPYMFLLSVYYILLYKYTSQEDIVVGSPIIGRDNSQLLNIIGMFVNTLALRSKISSNNSFEEFVNIVKATTLQAFENQTYPFDELVNNLNITRDASRNVLFDTMFTFQNGGNSDISFDGSTAEYYIPDTHISKFDLSLEVVPENDILNLNFEYCTKLFDKEFINRLSNHYINIIKSILENQEIKISDIDMLSKEEKNKILNEFNNTKMDYPQDKTVIDLFEEQVAKNPNKIAIVFEDKKLTYKELNEKANQVAYYLISQKVSSNDIIGIMLDRSLELIISMIGVLKSGAGYMLIDYNLPNDRIIYMLENAECKLFITNSNLKIINHSNILYIDNFNYKDFPNENLSINKNINNSFCVIYTSGSTGTPKGVTLKHQGIVNLIYSYKNILNTDICRNFLSISTVSFDMFMVETFLPIISGETMILSNEEEQKIPIYMSNLIIKHNVDFILTTPSRIELLLKTESTCLQNVKIIQLGGENFSKKIFNILNKNTNATIHNGYGPTETTACSSNKKIIDAKDITIGTPMGNTKIYILNKDNNLCPTNIIGQICVAGYGVSKGYINNIANTSKSFTQNPFENGLIYKTGDLGFYNMNNEIVFVGRNDNQIKIRGLRIELAEIENKLLSLPEIQKCIVLYKNNPNNSFLYAFFSAKDKLETKYIRNELSRDLPLYMIPKYLIQLDELPITTNGKIDKKSLENYELDFSIDENYVAPTNKLQKIFCETWEKLLNTRIGIDDNIFEKGADSLLAIQFKSALFEKKININYSDIFKYKTIRELANINQKEIEEPHIDYTYLNDLLATSQKETEIVSSNRNNVLLLGANGFVGMHIINDFIKNDKGNIYCVLRSKNNVSALERFKNTLHFYFGKSLDKYVNKRIFIIEATITLPNFGLSYQAFNNLISNISCIINSAALVKHYGNYDDFKQTNVLVIEKLIDFCIKYKKRLLQISTMSIAENINIDNTMVSNNYKENTIFSENTIYIGQNFNNIYLKSKFEAEKLIIENLPNGLDAQILRLGNMTSRYSDGQFQINPTSNTFVSHIQAFALLGYIPDYILDIPMDFTPVDYCSTAINKIMQNNNKDFTIFNLYNYNTIIIKDLINYFSKSNLKIDIISHEKFVDILYKALNTPNNTEAISRLLSDLNEDNKFDFVSKVSLDSKKTIDFLKSVNFVWPKVDKTYIKKYINYLRKIKIL